RGVDPVKLEQARMIHMSAGLKIPTRGSAAMYTFAYSTIQELATRISHRNTGKVCQDPVADKMLQRIAADENLHMIFYRNISAAGLDLAPDQAIRSITDTIKHFEMPGAGMPDFRRNGVLMAKHGIYDLRQ
ncbi:acyl-ACP desaturase, partial [Tsukamurella pulmonis]|uniref:acyl-ACP desaturase n=1 Tax=Tsukamurella pulmonis TaxID=47312 RepID=UPI000E13F21D